AAAPPPFCESGERPQFSSRMTGLRDRLGTTMGALLECEHTDTGSGDTAQKTTTGLACLRRATNTPSFTDGSRHWALTSVGLTQWTESTADPPAPASDIYNAVRN